MAFIATSSNSSATRATWTGASSLTPLSPRSWSASASGSSALSLVGLRLFSVIAQSAVLVLTGLMTCQFGGKRLAQTAAVLAVALSPLPLFEGTESQYTSFDYLWWVLCGYLVLRLLNTDQPRWWLAIGAAIGAGLMTKYTIVLLVLGLLSGLLLTGKRYLLSSRWFAAGVAIAFAIFLPNLLWQARHGFISFHFLHFIHARDVRLGRANGFLWKQFFICTNVYALPLWTAGLVRCWRSPRFRPVAFLFAVPFAILLFGKGIFYYLGPAYPILIAAGAASCARWLQSRSSRLRAALQAVFFAGLAGAGAYSCAFILPLASSGPLMRFALARNDALREEFGWDDLVRTVAAIRDTLPADGRPTLGIVVGNYGEQGAIDLLGPPYGLPAPISMTNSAWLRGYQPPPSTLIVIGFSREEAEHAFTACRLAGRDGNATTLKNEESEQHPDIFVCAGPKQPWATFWKENQRFG